MVRFICRWSGLVLNAGVSHHSPLLLKFGERVERGGRPFKNFNYLVAHSEFMKIVRREWFKGANCSCFKGIWLKLKRVKTALKTLRKEEFRRGGSKISALQCELVW